MNVPGANRLLFDESPLVVQPQLAVKIGLNEAIMLQQVHYWLTYNARMDQNVIDGEVWTYNPLTKWLEQFPFWSERTLWSIQKNLRNLGVLISAQLSPDKRDRTLWFRIDYDKLSEVCGGVAEVATCTSQNPRSASLQKLRDVNSEQRLATETSTKIKNGGERSSLKNVTEDQLLPTSETRSSSANTLPGIKLTDNAARAYTVAKAAAKSSVTAAALHLIQKHPKTWEHLADVFERENLQDDPQTFHSWILDLPQFIRAYGAQKVESDLLEVFQNPKVVNFWPYFKKYVSTPSDVYTPQRSSTRTRRGGADEAARLEQARSRRAQARKESFAAFGGGQ